MKKHGVVFAAVLLLAGTAWGQYGYLYQSGGWMFGAQFIGQEGWMVGAGGSILHTQDGGRNWVFQKNIERYDVSNPQTFTRVTFKTPRIGWACCIPLSCVWRTTDGGQFWQAESLSADWFWDTHLSFADTLHGWSVGNRNTTSRVFATTDGGRTWNTQSTSQAYLSVFAASPRQCWIVGYLGCEGRTTDGGQTWVEQQISPNNLWNLWFADTLYGWACGYLGTIVRTTDGGLSWSPQTSGTSSILLAVVFLDRARGFAVGDSGTMLKTTDGGANWASVPTGVKVTFCDLTFGDSLRGWAIGAEGGLVLETSDGGVTWRVTQKGMAGPVVQYPGGSIWRTERVQAVFFVDDSTGWAATWEGNIWNTRDGGKVWNKQTSVSPKPLLGLTMVNSNNGWAVGDSGLILATTNGGTTWTSQTSGTTRALWNVFASDLQHAWACGYGQRVIGTTDGGLTWNEQYRGDSTGFASAGDARPSRAGLVCGSNGLLLRTTNGSIWVQVTGPTASNLWGVSLGDDQKAWAAGWKGMRLKTTDQGLSWQTQSQDSLPDSLLISVQAFDSLTARVTGYLGRSVLTTDGGATWANEETGTDEWLLASSFLTPTLGWIGGENGMVLKYGQLPSGVETERGETPIPWITALEQNRPNPFAGKTEIRYQLAHQGRIRLLVYNVLGQVVRKLVDEERRPGSYEASWDGKNGLRHPMPSGVYFYRLEVQGTSQTRKMVKVK